MNKIFLGILLLIAGAALAADITRDGGTADWRCCTDKACTTIVVQKADSMRALIECGKLADADKVPRWIQSWPFKVTPSVVIVPPPPPPATTGSATLRWTPPTQNTDGSALTNLVGYTIVYGTSPTALTQTITLTTPSVSTYVVDKLAPGTWYFALYANAATQSAQSNIASKVL